jgi:NAD(P)-dependent dehydrogenase (short-subunit alcohol dehydrogenase family)
MPESQSIIISGAGSGFGALAALTLARQGHAVFAGLRSPTTRNADAANRLIDTARREGLTIYVVDLDVTDDQSVESAISEVIALAGHLDVVVNNAGSLYVGPLEAFRPEQVRQQFETNVVGTMRLNRAALPHLRAQRSGLLIQIGSLLGRLAFPYLGLYAASKFALEGLTEAYRLELAGHGIDVVIVEPGAHPTGLDARAVVAADQSRLGAYPEAQRGAAVVASAEANPQDVADAIARLVALPPGTRPLRFVVATDRERQAVEPLNAVSDQVIQAVMGRAGAGVPGVSKPA